MLKLLHYLYLAVVLCLIVTYISIVFQPSQVVGMVEILVAFFIAYVATFIMVLVRK